MKKGACIIGQSGGPTAVINSSLLGIVEKSIEENAFKDCKQLKSVFVGKNLKRMGNNPFVTTPMLTNITIHQENGYLIILDTRKICNPKELQKIIGID